MPNGKFFAGRRISWFIYERFKLSTEDGAILEFEDLLQVELKGDNVRAFQNDWEFLLSGLRHLPTPGIMESLYRKQLNESTQMKGMLQLYEQEITLGRTTHSYETLYNLVTAYLASREKQSTRDALSRRSTYGRSAPAREVGQKV